MKKILIIGNNSKIKEKLIENFSLNHKFYDLKIIEAITYKEALSIISKDSNNIELAIIHKHIEDATDGKAVMLASSNGIKSILVFEDYDKESKLDKKLLKISGVLKAFNQKNKHCLSALVDYVHKNIRNSAYTALVVDDSKLYREKFKSDLEKLNLNVILASDGCEAIDIFNSKQYEISLLITDYNMPKMDGIELVKNIRKKYANDELAIIAISVNDNNEVLTKFIKVGANDYINKPYSSEELKVRVTSNLNTLEMFEKITNLANRDFLTGAYNRRYFFESALSIIAKNYRKNLPIALATVDIDKFKLINDTYGHDIGDIAIKETIRLIKEEARGSDLIARFGGEEFCILFEDITLENAKKVFEKIRKKFENNKIIIDKEKEIKFTISIGACFKVSNDVNELIKISDKALYEAKETGRNKVIIFE